MFGRAQILSKLLPMIISGAAHGQLQASGGSQQVVQDETGRGGELLFIFLSTLTLSSKNVDYALKAKIKKNGNGSGRLLGDLKLRKPWACM